jgi:hypothetical protein
MGWGFAKRRINAPLPYGILSPSRAPQLFNPFNAHAYVQSSLPDPGADGWTYALWGMWGLGPIGTGIENRRQLRHTQPPPSTTLQAAPVTGLGGVQYGTLILSPLTLAGFQPSQGIGEGLA